MRSAAAVGEPRAQAGADAFAELYQAQFGRVYGYLRFLVGDAAVAEDLAAEVFVRAWAKRGELRRADGGVAWLFAVARHLSIDHRRARRDALPLDDPAAPGGLLATSPEDAVFRAEQRGRLGRGLGALGEREREIVGLRFGAGLRHREIARVVGTTEGNAAKILHRALRKLRDVIGDDEEAPR